MCRVSVIYCCFVEVTLFPEVLRRLRLSKESRQRPDLREELSDQGMHCLPSSFGGISLRQAPIWVRRRGGLVVERRTPEREVGFSILTQVAVLCL